MLEVWVEGYGIVVVEFVGLVGAAWFGRVFASLPLAFFGHEDTKQIGVGYLKRYATTALQGVMLIIAVKLYQALLGGWLGNNVHYDGTTDMWNFVISNFGSFLVAPAVLIFLLFGSNSLAKAIVGEG